MKRLFLALLIISALAITAAAQQGRPLRESGKETGLMLDLQKVSLGTISSVEQKKQYLSTVQLEKQRIQNFTLRMVYENAYTLYRRGDYQRAHELANVILSIDPSLTKAQTLATEAGRMATYGTISEQEIINMKYEEGINLYRMGRLVEAQSRFEEILVLRPNERRAQDWVKRIESEIAEQHIRRGYYAYKNNDFNEALNQWYSVLLIKKDDPDLIAKIAEVENIVKTEQNKEVLRNAFDLYSQGKLISAYKEFERAQEIQPGEQQTQRYLMQLKKEISEGYYDAGNKAYGSKKYNTAIANWKEAKTWGYNQNDINLLVKNAERAKTAAAEAAKRKPVSATTAGKATTGTAAAAAAAAQEPEEAMPEPEIIAPLPVTPVEPVGTGKTAGGGTTTAPIDTGSEPINVGTGEFPTKNLTAPGRVTEEARQASIARYKAGISYFNEGNYEKAKVEWQAALQLNPENSDASLGLKRIEAQYAGR